MPVADKSFQSTRPARAATSRGLDFPQSCTVSIHAPHAGRDFVIEVSTGTPDVSIHAPHAGRDIETPEPGQPSNVSIHAPHAGRDLLAAGNAPCTCVFQSTRPTRGATSAPGRLQVLSAVSIHAPHAGRDGASMDRALGDRVSIHAPHAGRDHLAS